MSGLPSSSSRQPDLPREIARRSKSNLAAALFWMPKSRRRDMHIFYAFCRMVDDDADDPRLSSEEKHRRLDIWRSALDAPTKEEAPCMGEMRDLLARRGIDPALPKEIIEGVRMDISPRRYPDFEALKVYCHRVAGVVGLVSVRIFGCNHPNSLQYAENLGQALQLTNILRDIGEDWRNGGRVYLPEADFAQCGYSPDELARGVRNAAFTRLMRLESERANAFYKNADSLVHATDRAALFPARLMSSVYQLLLRKLERKNFPVFDAPLRLGLVDRLRALALTLLR